MDRLAVDPDGGALEPAVLVLDEARLDDAAGAALDGLPVRLGGVRDGERDVLDAVAVPADVPRDLVVLAERARDDEADVALLQHVRGPVADPRLGPCIGRRREAEPA